MTRDKQIVNQGTAAYRGYEAGGQMFEDSITFDDPATWAEAMEDAKNWALSHCDSAFPDVNLRAAIEYLRGYYAARFPGRIYSEGPED